MEFLRNPRREDWTKLTQRPVFDLTQLFSIVQPILEEVQQRGDAALFELEEKFDKAQLTSLAVSQAEKDEANALVEPSLKEALQVAHRNITRFHEAQRPQSIVVETCSGIRCEQHTVAIEKVGLYVPGGTAPLLSTVLMLGIPAQIAGCNTVVLCTPPNAEGKINPAILYAASLCGIDNIYKVGGAQAIAAMAYGTESVPAVHKIFGPGNQYVMAAKQLVALSHVAIDMPAGPSEVEVFCDDTCVPAFVAADLLSQAEHGVDSQVILVCTDEPTLKQVLEEVEVQLARLPRKEIAEKALQNSKAILFDAVEAGVEFTNCYGPEHLILAVKGYRELAPRMPHAGSIFLGNYSSESAGDYASGTNHTLPTKGWVRNYSSLSLGSFMRSYTVQELTEEGVLAIGIAVEAMAEAEQLFAHKQAMTLRLQSLSK